MVLFDYRDVLHRVYDLSLAETTNNSKPQVVKMSDIDLNKYREERENSELLKYLKTLDKATIKVVLAVIYVGRDHELTRDEYKEMHKGREIDDEWLKDNVSLQTPIQYFEDIMDILDEANQYNIEQIYEKRTSLPKYLERAFKLLNL